MSPKCNDRPAASNERTPAWLAPIPSHHMRKEGGVDDAIFEYVYVAIAKRIVRGIWMGDLVAGRQLPKQREMAKAFEVSVSTVAKAIDVLKYNGVLESERGKGVFRHRGWRQGGHSQPVGNIGSRADAFGRCRW